VRVRTMLNFATLFLTCLVAVGSTPLISQAGGRPSPATQKGSVTGRISSIGDGSFAVEVKKSQDVVTVMFMIDDDTKIDGRLEVGAAATVDYRTDGSTNIATHIVVRPAIHSR
jgi:hypothetical protein